MVIDVDRNIYLQAKYKMNDSSLKSSINSFVHNYYGQFLYANKINDDNFWVSASLPYELMDNGKRLLRFDKYQDIAEIEFKVENNYLQISGLNRSHVKSIIDQNRSQKILKSEKLLFKVSQNKFIKIPEVSVFYKPIIEIITELHYKGSMRIEDNKSTQKLLKYGMFLEKLGILQIHKHDNFLEFNIDENFKLLESTSDSVENIFNYVLIHGYEYLSRIIGINSLSPYIKISNSLYYNIIQLTKNIEIDREELNQYYNKLYNKNMKDYQFNVYLDTLSDCNIIKRNNNKISGDDQITEQLLSPSS